MSTCDVMTSGVSRDGSAVQERIAFLVGRHVRVRVWWTEEGRAASPAGDLFEVTCLGCVPIGRDYYWVFATLDAAPKRMVIKTAAVLQVMEL